jgi:hypothetical protein
MISWRLALPAVVVSAVVAGCITYYIAPPEHVETVRQLPSLPPPPPPPKPNFLVPGAEALGAVQQPIAREKGVAEFEKAADEILRRAYAGFPAEVRPLTGHIPLPRKRPIPR